MWIQFCNWKAVPGVRAVRTDYENKERFYFVKADPFPADGHCRQHSVHANSQAVPAAGKSHQLWHHRYRLCGESSDRYSSDRIYFCIQYEEVFQFDSFA